METRLSWSDEMKMLNHFYGAWTAVYILWEAARKPKIRAFGSGEVSSS